MRGVDGGKKISMLHKMAEGYRGLLSLRRHTVCTVLLKPIELSGMCSLLADSVPN